MTREFLFKRKLSFLFLFLLKNKTKKVLFIEFLKVVIKLNFNGRMIAQLERTLSFAIKTNIMELKRKPLQIHLKQSYCNSFITKFVTPILQIPIISLINEFDKMTQNSGYKDWS